MSRDTGWAPILVSVGLFLVTTAVAQWAQALGRDFGKNDDDDDDGDYSSREENFPIDDEEENDPNLEDLRRWYRSRRVQNRVSYENLQHESLLGVPVPAPGPEETKAETEAGTATPPTLPPPVASSSNSAVIMTTTTALLDGQSKTSSGTSDPPTDIIIAALNDTQQTPSRRISEWDLQREQSRIRKANTTLPSFVPLAERGRENSIQTAGSMAAGADFHPNALYDFHPKNRNWRHFEHFNEQDRNAPSFQKESRAARTIQQFMHARMVDTDDETEEDDDDGDDDGGSRQVDSAYSISSEGSASDEEQFVWMKHSHRTSQSKQNSNTSSPLQSSSNNMEASWTESLRKRVPSFLNLFMEQQQQNTHNSTTVVAESTSQDDRRSTQKVIRRNSLSKSQEDYYSTDRPQRIVLRRNSLPANSSTTTTTASAAGNPMDRPQRRVLRRNSLSSTSSDRPRKVLRRNSLSSTSSDRPPNRHRRNSLSTWNEDQQQQASPPPNDDDEPRKALRRNSMPTSISSTHTYARSKSSEMPTSFPLALQRMLSRGNSSDDPSNRKRLTHQESSSSSRAPTNIITNIPHSELRAQYNATIMPEKVILIRHGQSMGNINELLYATTPDNAMPLTKLGWEQARVAGNTLKEKILASGESVHFIVSPYVRTVETFHGMVSAWCDPKEFSHITNKEKRIKAWYRRLMEMGLTWNEDSRIREQDFGNYQDPEIIRKAKQERHRFGIFYYRYPHGESASDVFDRVSTFLDSLWRSFEMNKSRNYVLVTHGISIRVLLARYFRYTIDQFNILANPTNCEMVILGHNGQGRLELQGRCALEVGPKPVVGNEDEEKKEGKDDQNGFKQQNDDELHVTGYKFHKRLRILPKHAIRKVKIRISPDD